MALEADMDHKLNPANRHSQQPHHGLHTQDTLSSHEHPTSGTVLSMMPSFTETFLGPQAGTIQSSGICLKTSTWLLLYALPFIVAVAFLGFVLGQVETLWSKISCIIGSAICYMACWALVVAVMDPDHESRTILMSMESAHEHAHRNDESHGAVSTNGEERSISLRSRNSSTINLLLEDDRITEGYSTARISSLGSTGISRRRPSSSITNGSGSQSASSSTSLPQDTSGDNPLLSSNMLFPFMASSTSASTTSSPSLLSLSRWRNNRYAQELQNRVLELAEILDDFPDTIGEW